MSLAHPPAAECHGFAKAGGSCRAAAHTRKCGYVHGLIVSFMPGGRHRHPDLGFNPRWHSPRRRA